MVFICKNASEALDGLLFDNMTIMSGGFGLCGIPENSILTIRDSGIKNITFISNDCGNDDFGLGVLLKTKQIKKMISSYVGENKYLGQQYLSGELELELTPQGTLAEKIRAGGAGIPAFYTRTGLGTVVAENKEHKFFDGEEYIMEIALKADLSIIKGMVADTAGNVIYNKTARNFNPLMATASKYTVIEVEKIVEVGQLDPNHIHTPGIYVDKLFVGTNYQRKIEHLTIRAA